MKKTRKDLYPLVAKKWGDLTEEQKKDYTQQLEKAGWKDPKEYNRIKFMFYKDGSPYGWSDPNFFSL